MTNGQWSHRTCNDLFVGTLVRTTLPEQKLDAGAAKSPAPGLMFVVIGWSATSALLDHWMDEGQPKSVAHGCEEIGKETTRLIGGSQSSR
jgi:hypothetical protein